MVPYAYIAHCFTEPKLKRPHFADDIIQGISRAIMLFVIQISLRWVPNGPIQVSISSNDSLTPNRWHAITDTSDGIMKHVAGYWAKMSWHSFADANFSVQCNLPGPHELFKRGQQPKSECNVQFVLIWSFFFYLSYVCHYIWILLWKIRVFMSAYDKMFRLNSYRCFYFAYLITEIYTCRGTMQRYRKVLMCGSRQHIYCV